MAAPIRVVLRMMYGEPMRQASADAKKEAWSKWNEIQEEWKNDPGIKFCSYYWTTGRSLDGYCHHWLFEVDDVSKIQEMNGPISMGDIGPFEKYSFEVVFGNPNVDAFWDGVQE